MKARVPTCAYVPALPIALGQFRPSRNMAFREEIVAAPHKRTCSVYRKEACSKLQFGAAGTNGKTMMLLLGCTLGKTDATYENLPGRKPVRGARSQLRGPCRSFVPVRESWPQIYKSFVAAAFLCTSAVSGRPTTQFYAISLGICACRCEKRRKVACTDYNNNSSRLA